MPFMVKIKDEFSKIGLELVDKCINVYDVKINNNGYPHFLIYINNEWKYVSAKYFEGL